MNHHDIESLLMAELLKNMGKSAYDSYMNLIMLLARFPDGASLSFLSYSFAQASFFWFFGKPTWSTTWDVMRECSQNSHTLALFDHPNTVIWCQMFSINMQLPTWLCSCIPRRDMLTSAHDRKKGSNISMIRLKHQLWRRVCKQYKFINIYMHITHVYIYIYTQII